jgi:hypothetical protein
MMAVVPLLAVGFILFDRVPMLRGAGEAIREHLLKGLLPPILPAPCSSTWPSSPPTPAR